MHRLIGVAPLTLAPKLIGAVCLALADAFDLGRMEQINFWPALAAVLAMNATSEMQRAGKDVLQLGTRKPQSMFPASTLVDSRGR